MAKKKDKNYRRKIEALKAQLSSQNYPEAPLAAPRKRQPVSLPQGADTLYTPVEVVKKEVVKSLLLSLVCFFIILAAYFLQKFGYLERIVIPRIGFI